MEIRLRDVMCRSFRFLIKDEFRLELFRKAIEKEGMIKNLAKKLGCNRDSIRIMKIGQTKFIKWQIVKKLIDIVGISEEELEPHILTIKGGMTGKTTEIKFPIKESPKLALLVAKGMGDGTIEKDKFRFSFWNKEEELIKEVCDCVNKSIGKTKGTINKLKDGRIQVKFCPFVAFVLHKEGVPIGNKTIQDFDVPNWIRNGSREIKTSFLKGLFDDEAHVQNRKKTRRTMIFLGKWIEKRKSLENFLLTIKEMLLEFGINSTKIRKQDSFIDENNKEKVIMGFSISRKENLEKFLINVSFTHPKKNLILKEAIKSFVDIHKNRNKILEILSLMERPLSIPEISKLTGLNQKLIWAHMPQLLKEELITKNNDKKPTLWSLKNMVIFSETKNISTSNYFQTI